MSDMERAVAVVHGGETYRKRECVYLKAENDSESAIERIMGFEPKTGPPTITVTAKLYRPQEIRPYLADVDPAPGWNELFIGYGVRNTLKRTETTTFLVVTRTLVFILQSYVELIL